MINHKLNLFNIISYHFSSMYQKIDNINHVGYENSLYRENDYLKGNSFEVTKDLALGKVV